MSQCLDDNSALELLDGRLASAARARVERHLESCDACRELVAELAKADSDGLGYVTATQSIPGGSGSITHAGPYRIDREIGRGSAGTVYRAVDERTGEAVALKYVTDSVWRARFGREIETLAGLTHPGIVRYVGHGETAHGMYLAMELLDGEDLEQCLCRGPLPWQAVRRLGLRLTAALAHAHARGAVHRDLGPRNIFLPCGRVEDAKLLDFGLVRVSDGLERTASRAVLGTAFYMAPEQIKNPRDVDARADLFALGVILFEAVSGMRPFEGEDLFTIWVRIVDHPPPNLRTMTRGIPEAFLVLIEALLAKDPNARPASADAVHHSLMLLEGLERNSPPGIRQASSSRRRSGIFLAVGAGVTALVAASMITVATHRRSSGTPSMPDEPSTPSAPGESSAPSEAANESEDPPASRPDTPVGAASSASPVSSKGVIESFFCGGDDVKHHIGGHYRPGPETEQAAVWTGGGCKATLEDCVIDGPRSVRMIGHSELTLRRCRVLGDVSLVGPVTLTLEGTTLAKAPLVVGAVRIINR